MSCPIRTEGQEYVCSTCGIRWDFGDEQPECRKDGLTKAFVAPASVLVEPSTWKPSPRAELAARLRKVLAMQTGHGQNPVAIGITPTFARDLLAELERQP